MWPCPPHSRVEVPKRGSWSMSTKAGRCRGKAHLSSRCLCRAEEPRGPGGLEWEWVEAGARKLDSRLKRDVQIFAGLNKQPSELQLQRGWRWGRTQLARVCVSKVVTT